MAETTGLAALGVNPLYLIGQVVNFVILMLILKKFLYRPVLKKLEERAKQVKRAQESAEEIMKRQDQWKVKQKKVVQEFKEKTAKMLAQAQKQGQEEKQRIINEAQEEAKAAAQAEYAKLEQKLKDQEKKLRQNTGELVVATTKKLLSEYLGKDLQTTILKKQLKKLPTVKVR